MSAATRKVDPTAYKTDSASQNGVSLASENNASLVGDKTGSGTRGPHLYRCTLEADI